MVATYGSKSKQIKRAVMAHQHERPIVIVIGTRPEGIKMAPVYHALKAAGLPVLLCSSGQHKALLHDVFDLFEIVPDVSWAIMRPGQDLFYLTHAVLNHAKQYFQEVNPRLILVQGDTTTAMAAALCAFYLHIPVGHVEAGLRTDDIMHPFPEEMNRRIISLATAHHFVPTTLAQDQLCREHIRSDRIHCVGNTVVDALYQLKQAITAGSVHVSPLLRERIEHARMHGKRIIAITLHRRELLEQGVEHVLATLKRYFDTHEDAYGIYAYHPNPAVVRAIGNVGLAACGNVWLSEPFAYPDMVYLLDAATCVVTDSGGLQEEAVSLGKTVLVLRDKTERMEGVLAGYAHLVGTDPQAIYQALEHHAVQHQQASGDVHVYGDGKASERIAQIIKEHYYSHMDEACAHEARKVGMESVCVVGLGYIGLPTALLAARCGYDVAGYDIDASRVERINQGNPVICEPEVYEHLIVALEGKNFKAHTAVHAARYFIIAVPTPITHDKKADLSAVFAAADAIVPVLESGNVVIIESTISVGTTERIAEYLAQKTGLCAGKDFYVAHCPERVLPGKIFKELVSNDRLIGGVTPACARAARLFYEPFVKGELHVTQARMAELVKLVENSARDVEIAFAHDVASMAQELSLDPYEVIELANKHPRVNILRPTCGVGGHCIAVDPWFLVEGFPQSTQLLKAARMVNDARPYQLGALIEHAARAIEKENGIPCTVLLLGATYKPNVDDLRESPALHVGAYLKEHNVNVSITDPHADQDQLARQTEVTITTLNAGIQRADLVVFLVAHDRFKTIDRALLEHKKVLDFCGILYESRKLHAQRDTTFWPAHSALDFFIVNQQQVTSTSSGD